MVKYGEVQCGTARYSDVWCMGYDEVWWIRVGALRSIMYGEVRGGAVRYSEI